MSYHVKFFFVALEIRSYMSDTPLLAKLIITYHMSPCVNVISPDGTVVSTGKSIKTVKDPAVQEIIYHKLSACTGFKLFKAAAAYGVVGRAGREVKGENLQVMSLGKFAYDREKNIMTADATYNRKDGRDFVVDLQAIKDALVHAYGEGAREGYLTLNNQLIKPNKGKEGYELVWKFKKAAFTQKLASDKKPASKSTRPALLAVPPPSTSTTATAASTSTASAVPKKIVKKRKLIAEEDEYIDSKHQRIE